MVFEPGCVVSTPILGRRVQSSVSATDGLVASTPILHMYNFVTGFRRVVTAPDLPVLFAYLDLPLYILYIIVEPTRSRVQAALHVEGVVSKN